MGAIAMKKILLRGIVVLLMLCGISSCTQNDGNIGEWFGHWKLNTISVNGAVDDEYGGNIFFSFQSKTFCQTMMYADHRAEHRFANWDNRDTYFIITFPFETDDAGNPLYDEDGDLVCLYEPLEITRMSMGENVVAVDYLNGNSLQLSMTDAAGDKVVYNLEKW